MSFLADINDDDDMELCEKTLKVTTFALGFNCSKTMSKANLIKAFNHMEVNDEVREFARIREIEGYETMQKAELIDAIWRAFEEHPRVDNYLTF